MQMYTRWATILHHYINSLAKMENISISLALRLFEDVRISMKGSHQVGNAALALMAVMYVKHTYHFN